LLYSSVAQNGKFGKIVDQPMVACRPARIRSRAHAKIPAKPAAFARMASFATNSLTNANAPNDAKPSGGGTAIESRVADVTQQTKMTFASCPNSLAHARRGKAANGISTARSRNANASDKTPVERMGTRSIRRKPVSNAALQAALLKRVLLVADDAVEAEAEAEAEVEVEEIHAEMLARTIAPLVT